MEALSIKKSYDKFKLLPLVVFLFFTSANAQIDTPEDCIDAYRICDANLSYYFEVNGAGSIDDANGALGLFCLNQSDPVKFEHNSAWFTFSPQYSGEFGFLICPDIIEDWDFALFGNNPDCSNLADNSYWIRCNASPPDTATEGCTGIGFKNGFGGGGSDGLLAYINIQAGDTYVLHAQCRNYPTTTPRRATLTFQGSVVTSNPDLFDFVGCTMATNDFILQDKVKVFPNPFQDSFNIESSLGLKKIEMYNVLGERVLSQSFANQINTANLQSGMYFMKLYIDDEVVVKKVIKE